MNEIQAPAYSSDTSLHVSIQRAYRHALFTGAKPVAHQGAPLTADEFSQLVLNPRIQTPAQREVIAAIELGHMRASKPGLFSTDDYDRTSGKGAAARVTGAFKKTVMELVDQAGSKETAYTI